MLLKKTTEVYLKRIYWSLRFFQVCYLRVSVLTVEDEGRRWRQYKHGKSFNKKALEGGHSDVCPPYPATTQGSCSKLEFGQNGKKTGRAEMQPVSQKH